MEEKSLSVAFADSLKEESISCIGEYAEIGLDAVMEDGILKDIPIVSTAIALYKIGSSIKERHNLKKLLVFLNELNNGILDEQKRKEYQQKFQSNEKFRNQEIEYLLVLIDRYINYDKPKLLAKLYLAYLKGDISWVEFVKYAEVIDLFLNGDLDHLVSHSITYVPVYITEEDVIGRFYACGLLEMVIRDQAIALQFGTVRVNSMDGYALTQWGYKLRRILK